MTAGAPVTSEEGVLPQRVLRVAMIMSRDGRDAYGRGGTVRSIEAAAEAVGTRLTVRCYGILEGRGQKQKSWRRLISATGRFVGSLATLRPMPLQCALYADDPEARRVVAELRALSPDVVYVDMIRLARLLPAIRAVLPQARLVLDMDDLLSRRFTLLVRHGLPLSLGYLRTMLPPAVARWLEHPALAALQLRYEAAALRRLERWAVQCADAVVLVSSTDAGALRAALPAECTGKVMVIPPPATVRQAPEGVIPPYRFVFIGSDRQVQNRLSIDFLLALWRDHKPTADLLIVGRQERAVEPVPGVHWLGFVEDLADLYDIHGILLAPTFLGGGVKTKVLEAFGYGRPVVGTVATFEGIDLPEYPLCLEESGLIALIRHPEARAGALTAAAEQGAALVRDRLGDAHHRRAWESVFRDGGER